MARAFSDSAVHLHVAVADDLARRERRRGQLGAIDGGVETALQQADHVLAGVAAQAVRLGENLAELTLGDVAVIALERLLGAQLDAEVRDLALAARAVLAGAGFALVGGALRRAPEILADAARNLVFRLKALAHCGFPYEIVVRFGKRPSSAPKGADRRSWIVAGVPPPGLTPAKAADHTDRRPQVKRASGETTRPGRQPN